MNPADCLIQQAVAGLSIGFVLIDPGERIVWLNRAAERLLGLSAAACVGRPFKRAFRDPQLAGFWEEAACREGNCIANVTVRWPEERELKLNATRCLDGEGREIGRALLFCDVTSDRNVKLEMTREVASRLLDLADNADGKPAALRRLTPQELRTLRVVGRGLSNDGVASELGVAVSTVRSHLKSVYRKLGLRTRGEAVRFAVRQRLT